MSKEIETQLIEREESITPFQKVLTPIAIFIFSLFVFINIGSGEAEYAFVLINLLLPISAFYSKYSIGFKIYYSLFFLISLVPLANYILRF